MPLDYWDADSDSSLKNPQTPRTSTPHPWTSVDYWPATAKQGEVHHPACSNVNPNHNTNSKLNPNLNPNPTADSDPNPNANL